MTDEVTDLDLSAAPTPDKGGAAATERELGSLHKVVAVALKEAISSPGKDGVSAAVLGAAITFLKNNNITASPTENAALADLNKTLNNKRRRGLTPAQIKEAAEQFALMQGGNGMPLQ